MLNTIVVTLTLCKYHQFF